MERTSTHPVNDPELWREYHETTDKARFRHVEQQIQVHLWDYIKRIVYTWFKHKSWLFDQLGLESTDLINDVYIAVFGKIAEYQPSRNTTFLTYVAHRINGQIRDIVRKNMRDLGVRKRGKNTRLIRLRHNKVWYGNVDVSWETSEKGNYTGFMRQPVTFDPQMHSGSAVSKNEWVVNEAISEALEAMQVNFWQEGYREPKDKRKKRKTVVNGSRVRQIFQMRLQGMTAVAIGEVYGVSESRICQILSKGYAYLRSHLESKGYSLELFYEN